MSHPPAGPSPDSPPPGPKYRGWPGGPDTPPDGPTGPPVPRRHYILVGAGVALMLASVVGLWLLHRQGAAVVAASVGVGWWLA